MAGRSWTLLQLRTRARSESDMINSEFCSDAEVTDWINSNLCEVYDLLVQAGPPDYYASSMVYTTTPGTVAYPLPDDFRNMTTLYGTQANPTRLVPIEMVNDYDLAQYQPPQGAYTLRLEYVPVPPVLVADDDEFAGISGWEELIVAMTARDMLLKEESDVSGMVDRIERLKKRIRTASSQRGSARYMTDVSNARSYWYFDGTSVQVTGFRIRGNNIEFYQPAFWGYQ